MPRTKVVLITAPSDQGDILQDFLDWHLDLGVDLILALDHGSTDGSRALLDRYAKTGRVVWFPVTERDISKYSPADELAALARDRHGADWIIHCDVDEFLSTSGVPLRDVLARAERDGQTLISVPRRTMTGPLMAPGQKATEALTLRIDSTVCATALAQVTWDLPVPFAFLDVGDHLIVRASAFERYGTGAHFGTVSWGRQGEMEGVYILHYAMRGFETLQAKVENTRSWLAANTHLPPGTCWHWRRWIHLNDQGLLRDDYEQQFVSPERGRELVRTRVCAIDRTVADWLERRQAAGTPATSGWSWLSKLTGGTGRRART